MARGELCVKTPGSRSSASLRFITAADQRCGLERRRARAFLVVWGGLRVLPAGRRLLALLPRVMLEATVRRVRVGMLYLETLPGSAVAIDRCAEENIVGVL